MIKLRRDTGANWVAANPVLPYGQPAYDLTNNHLKIGDGVTAWNSLTAIGDVAGGDHGLLAGLADDDHVQYHNDIRGDARYLRKLNNVIVINSESDFPIQDATTITLSNNTAYVLGSLVTTAKRFIVGSGVTLTSISIFSNTLEYTGTGVMFTIAAGDFAIFDISYSCANGTVFSHAGGTLILERTACLSCVNVGSITGSGTTSLNWANNSFPAISGQGLQLFGSIFVFSFTKMFMLGSSASFIALNLGAAVFYTIEISNIELFGVLGSIGMSGLTNSGNMSSGSVATVDSSNLSGTAMVPLSGITSNDVRWHFEGNADIEETMEDALTYFSGNTTDTIITASSTNGANAVKIAGTWVAGGLSKFTADATGRVTSKSERGVTVPIDVSVLIMSVGGGAVRAALYLAKNGTVIAAATTAADVSGSTSKNISFPWQESLSENEYLEIFVENQTNANDLLVENAIFRIR